MSFASAVINRSKQTADAVLEPIRLCRRVGTAAWMVLAAAGVAMAQHPASRPPKTDTSMAGMPGMDGELMAKDSSMSTMMISGALGIPMSRMGSGTSWLPDAAPMHAHHMMTGPWELMVHGVAFGMYDRQNGPRGAEQFSSVNWGMLMASRSVAGGKLSLRGMMSLEPFTLGGNGYPLLLQTGEVFQGQPLHDRQHPHDLFMEIAGLYERQITPKMAFSVYVAPVGEPASGPVAFPHRPSAMNDPLAPIGHHWQDATHISFGVLTAGVFTRSVRVEGSLFNGREPDENRTNFDYRGRSFDSYAGRITWNPTGEWSLSGSFAYLNSPESAHPEESLHRVSASVLNYRRFGAAGDWSTAFVFGANQLSSEQSLKASYLAETNLEFGNGHAVFGRAEYVEKSADDLVLGSYPPARTFNVGAVALGYLYEFDRQGTIRTGLGVRGSVSFVPASLAAVYGGRQPTGFAIYVRFRPAPMADHQAGATPGHSMDHGVEVGSDAQPPNRPIGFSADSAEAVATVARFHSALASGDSAAALRLLAPDALIVESGDVQTREEYRLHHLSADLVFAAAVPSVRTVTQVTISGNVAWITATSTTKGSYRDRPVNSVGAELTVLSRTGSGWQIRSVHWSSHAKRS